MCIRDSFNLDRWLLTSYRKVINQFVTFLTIIPRLALAALFGFIISEPMVLEIFGSEIEEELRDIDEETRQARLEAIAGGPESLQITDKRTEIAELESRLGQSEDVEIEQLQADIDEQRELLAGWEDEVAVARTALLESQAALEEEVIDGCLDGGAGCEPGRGPIARQKEREVELRQQELNAVEGRLNPKIAESDGRITQLQASIDTRREQISADLSAADDEIGQQIRTLNGEIDELEALMNDLRFDVNDGETNFGILARIDALDRLREESANVNRLYWLLTSLFIAIDTIPILGKWFMSFGSPRPYELLRDAKERGIQAQVVKAIERHELDEQVQSAANMHLASAQAANDQHFINHWATINRGLGQAQLTDWEGTVLPAGYQQVAVEDLPNVDGTISIPFESPSPEVENEQRSAIGARVLFGVALVAIVALGLGFFLSQGRSAEEADAGSIDSEITDSEITDSESGSLPPGSTTSTSQALIPSIEDSNSAGPIPTTEVDATTDAELAEEAAPDGDPSPLAVEALRPLISDPDPTRPSYDRDAFNEGQDLDQDCLRTRPEILLEEGQDVELAECDVISGVWDDPFSGRTITDPAELQVDHVVSLNDAWDSGAWAFTPEQLTEFSNSPANLNAIHGPENERKANLGPSGYSPSNAEQTCAYLTQYASVKIDWGLSISSADFDAVETGLANCQGPIQSDVQTLTPTTVPAAPVTEATPATEAPPAATAPSEAATETTAAPATAPAATAATEGNCHPSYSPCLPITGDLNCGDLAGGQKPVTVTGSDPYGLDADDDGVGCERG